jgi:hypothetical protein
MDDVGTRTTTKVKVWLAIVCNNNSLQTRRNYRRLVVIRPPRRQQATNSHTLPNDITVHTNHNKGLSIDPLFLRFVAHVLVKYEGFLDEALIAKGGDVLGHAHSRAWIVAPTADALKQYIKSNYWPLFEKGTKVLYRDSKEGDLNRIAATISDADADTGSYVLRGDNGAIKATSIAFLEPF